MRSGGVCQWIGEIGGSEIGGQFTFFLCEPTKNLIIYHGQVAIKSGDTLPILLVFNKLYLWRLRYLAVSSGAASLAREKLVNQVRNPGVMVLEGLNVGWYNKIIYCCS